MSNQYAVDWGDPTVGDSAGRSRKVERFRGKQNKVHRLVILTERPFRTVSHYKRSYGYFACLKFDGLECVACAANDRPQEKFACNVLVYPEGAQPGVPWDPTQARVMLWEPGPKVFADIRAIFREWGPLQNYDLSVNCTNEQYQHLNVTPTPKLLWREHPQAEALANMIAADSYDLIKLVGRNKETVEEVRQIWQHNATRDQIKAQREKDRGPAGNGLMSYAASPAPAPSQATYAPPLMSGGAHAPHPLESVAQPTVAHPSMPPTPAMPNFSDLLRTSATPTAR